ncbi:unnamed protein product [Closterium sp. Naga37s-1]|nr:unnamed protein product [Closterium sp. Naga37s-1]
MVVMARFVGESGMRPYLSTDGDAAPTAVSDAVSDAINDAVSDAGSETFLFPTPPRSPREISRTALEFRHGRRRHSFSGFQELPAGCGVRGAPESLDGATNGDIAYPGATNGDITYHGANRVNCYPGGEDNTRSAEERCDLPRLPRPSAVQYSAPLAAGAAAAAAADTRSAAVPAEARGRPDQIHGPKSNAMWPRITARVKKRILSGEAVAVSPCGSGILAEDSTHWPCLLIADITPLSSFLVVSSLVPPTTVRAVVFKAHLAAATF